MSLPVVASAVITVGVEVATLLGYDVSPGLAMLLLAPCVLHLGASKAAAAFDTKKDQPPVSEQDALAMPFVAGAALVSLYVAFKYLDVALVNTLLLAYFVFVGVGCCGGLVYPFVARAWPRGTTPLFTIPAIPYVLPDPIPVNPAMLVSGLLGSGIPAYYAVSKHWLANNALGMAFTIEGLALVDLGSFQTGGYMLAGLFLYDIFMVFGTKKMMSGGGPSVMEAVATSVDGPIKLVFPIPAEQAAGRERPYSLLGLGDIIVPGIFLVLLLRFDAHKEAQRLAAKEAAALAAAAGTDTSTAGGLFDTAQAAAERQAVIDRVKAAGEAKLRALRRKNKVLAGEEPEPEPAAVEGEGGGAGGDGPPLLPVPAPFSYPTPYFNVGFLAYVGGLCATLAAMHWANTAQPALLYLCPACGLAPLLLSLASGDFTALMEFRTDGEGEGERDKKGKTGSSKPKKE